MNWKYLLLDFWSWIVEHGLTLAAAIIVGILIPRIGRLIVRIVTERMTRGEEQTKSQLALVGALVYILEVVAYFFVVYTVLTNLGVSAVGAAVPATVVSAAIGFGAQTVIGDFLSGFFIISEHQYGVGDTVSFDGVSE
jgi:small conductance mechanosensitive channel